MHRALLMVCGALALAGCTVAPPASDVDAQASSAPDAAVVPNANAFALDGAPVPVDGQTQATTTAFSDFTMTVDEAGFQHARLEVLTSATVFWWNVDDVVHAVYSDDGQFASSGPISPGSEFGRTFLSAGEYGYHCPFHPDMKGTIVVLSR